MWSPRGSLRKLNANQTCGRDISFPCMNHSLFTHTLFFTHAYMFTHSEVPKHPPSKSSLALPLCWNCKRMPFQRGTQPATRSTLPGCDPCMCGKRKHLTFWPFLLMLSRSISSSVQYGPSTVISPFAFRGKCWRKVEMPTKITAPGCVRARGRACVCFVKIQYISFKCVFPFLSVSCNGFIPAVAFYQREHQSTRLTFNPKPGQVEKHTYCIWT